MVDFDDLRGLADEGVVHDEEEDIEEFSIEKETSLFLGMTPMERMFLSIFLFINVAILGAALLLVTNRV